MASDSQYLYMPAPYEGEDHSVPPHQLPPTRSSLVTNFLVHEDKRLLLRGSVVQQGASSVITSRAGVAVTNNAPIMSVTAGPANVLFQAADMTSTSNQTLAWDMFEAPGVTPSMPTARPLLRTTSTGVWTTPASGPHMSPGFVPAFYNDQAWSIGLERSTGAADIVYNGTSHQRTELVAMNLGTGGVGTAGASAPRAAQGIAAYAQRLWVLGGTESVTVTPLRPSTLWFTNPGASPSTLDSWRTNGIANQIVVDTEAPNDWGMALASLSKQLVIFKRRSMYALYGTGVDSFTVNKISDSIGTIDPRSVTVVEDTVYFLAERGLYSYDGSTVTFLSERVRRDFAKAFTAYTSYANRSARVTALPNNYLLVTVSLGTDVPFGLSKLYHLPTQRWTTFSTSVLPSATVRTSARVRDAYYAYHTGGTSGAFTVVPSDISSVTEPERAGTALGLDLGAAGAETVFLANVDLVPVRVSAPAARTHLTRIGIEGCWQRTDVGFARGDLVMTLFPYTGVNEQDLASAEIGTAVQLPTLANNSLYEYTLQPNVNWVDNYSEVTDFVARIIRATSGTLPGIQETAELWGAMVEYQAPTQKRY